MDEEGSIDSALSVSLLARLDVLGMLIGRLIGPSTGGNDTASQMAMFFHINKKYSQGGGTGNVQASIREQQFVDLL
jgi:hypothetical protein